MDATELQKENERLKGLLAQQRKSIEQQRQQHRAELKQFTQTIESKQQAIARLEHQIKLLLQKVRGSRQERIDPAQLTLFSLEDLEALAAELEKHAGDEVLLETEPSGKGKRRRGRKGKLPENLVFPIRSVQFAKHEKRIEREGFRSLASPTKVPSMSPLFSPSSVAKFAGANAARATNG